MKNPNEMGSVLLTIAVTLLFLILLLAVPVTLAFRVERIRETEGQVMFRWLFGLVRYRVGIPGDLKGATKQKQKPRKKPGMQRRRNNSQDVFTLLRDAALRRRLLRFIKDLMHASHARDLYLRLRVGLEDPADTGHLWAFLGPVSGIAANLQNAEVRIEPEFMDSLLEFDSHGELRLIPLQLIVLSAVFALSPESLRALRTLRRNNM